MAAYAGKVGIDPDTVYMLVDRVRFNLQNECGSDLGMQNGDTIHCRRHNAMPMFSSRSIDEGFMKNFLDSRDRTGSSSLSESQIPAYIILDLICGILTKLSRGVGESGSLHSLDA